MKIKNHSTIKNPIINKNGEKIFELFGNDDVKNMSICYVVIPKGCASDTHYHKREEEFYHIIKGNGVLTVNGNSIDVKSGDTILIEPNDVHTIKNARGGKSGIYLHLFAALGPERYLSC